MFSTYTAPSNTESKQSLPGFSELQYTIPPFLLPTQPDELKDASAGLKQLYFDCMRETNQLLIRFNNKKIDPEYFPKDLPSLSEIQKGTVEKIDLVRDFLIKALTLNGFLKLITIHDQLEIGMYSSFLFDFLDKERIGTGGADKIHSNYSYNEKENSLILQTIVCGIHLHDKDNPENNLEDKDNPDKRKKELADLFHNATFGTERIQQNDGSVKRRFITNNHYIPIALFKDKLVQHVKSLEINKDQKAPKEQNYFSPFLQFFSNQPKKNPLDTRCKKLIKKLSQKEFSKKFALTLSRLETSQQIDTFIKTCLDIQEIILPKIRMLTNSFKQIFNQAIILDQEDDDNWNTVVINPCATTLALIKTCWSLENLVEKAATHILDNTTTQFIDQIKIELTQFSLLLIEMDEYQHCLQEKEEPMLIPEYIDNSKTTFNNRN